MGKRIKLTELEWTQVDQVLEYSLGQADLTGQWGRSVTLVAQGLKGIKTLAGLSWRQVLPLLKTWIEDLCEIGTFEVEPDVAAERFADVWPKIRNPFRFADTALERAVAAAEYPTDKVRTIAERLYPQFPLMLKLMGVCASLAGEGKDGVFFLSARTATKALGLREAEDFPRVARLLRLLTTDGILLEVSKGVGMRASRYRWR